MEPFCTFNLHCPHFSAPSHSLSNNFAKGNAAGFRLSDPANNNTVSSNIADNNNYDSPDGPTEGVGYIIQNSDDNALSDNITINKDFYGITFSNSDNNTLINNTANYNGIGFLLSESDENVLLNNTANKNNVGNGAGFQLTGEDNNVTNNFANGNKENGIYLVSSNQTLIKDDIANGNQEYGINLKLSDKNTVTDNIFKYNEEGCIEEGSFCVDNVFNNNICEDPEDPEELGDNVIPGYHIMTIIGITTIIFSFLLVRQKEVAQQSF